MTVWRLIRDGLADGYTNMAVDEAILESHATGQVPPTVRLYGWQPPCLSIGYFQHVGREIDEAECRRLGVDWVRRPTGGRAILHQAELTYSLVALEGNPLIEGSVRTSYRKVSTALVAGLRWLGAEAETTPAQGRGPGLGSAACFDAPSDFEITIGGRKLVGSAQTRRRGALLQHGSILLDVDLDRQVAVLCPPRGMTRQQLAAHLRPRLISLREALGCEITAEELGTAVRIGFEQAWGITFREGSLTAKEQDRAKELQAKYADDAWNRRR
jgi:lipoate-protein ligase A